MTDDYVPINQSSRPQPQTINMILKSLGSTADIGGGDVSPPQLGYIPISNRDSNNFSDVLTSFNVKQYGAFGAYDDAVRDTDAINAALAARTAAGGGEIFFPALPLGRSYRYNGTLPTNAGIVYRGTDRLRTRILMSGYDVFSVPSGTSKDVRISGLTFGVTNGHFLNVAPNCHCYYWRISDCVITVNSNDKSFLFSRGLTNYLENYWENLDIYRAETATVPGFDVINSLGGANCNVFKRIRATGNNCTAAPMWRFEADTTGTYTWDNKFEDIVGEQNAGGLIHGYSAQGWAMSNVYDYDTSVTYTGSVIKFDKSSTSTTETRNIFAVNAGRRGGTLGVGLYDFEANTNARSIYLYNVGNHTSTPVVKLPAKAGILTTNNGIVYAAADTLTTGLNTTGNRPAAATVGQGAQFYDTTLGKPIWSTGAVWKDAAGNTV